ncbi:hypothetical protein ACL7TT_20450 [Microbulbifer sp. 2304DJ12-6]|uniref:hypothetical protein n=1 Tax=Microbulbifer sp. 2304DJ12-6 TaxID=3233340 RepID=UPI0039AF731F
MFKNTLILVGATLTFSVNAEIIDLGNISLDTSSGLEWLDLTATTGYSIDQLTILFDDSNSYFYGWSLATLEDTQQFMVNFGIPLAYKFTGGSTVIDQAIKNASMHLGDTVNLGYYYENGFLGLVEGGQFGGFLTIGAYSLTGLLTYGIETLPYSAEYASSHSSPWIGVYLNRSSEVPFTAPAW